MALTQELGEYVRTLIRRPVIYGAYLSVGLFVEGSDQEKIIFEMLHVIQVNIEHSGTLSERYQAMAPC